MTNSHIAENINISIVTVAMNRTQHLRHSTLAVSALPEHTEHIILDYGSEVPINRDHLPNDERIKLFRASNDEGKWWLTHSYNLAFALAKGNYILKLDADVLLKKNYINTLIKRIKDTGADLLCNRLTLQDWSLPDNLFTTNGLFCIKRESLEKVNGFNPYIRGWGWDEIDLYSRLFLSGLSIGRLPSTGVDVIEHSDHLRDTQNRKHQTCKLESDQVEAVDVPANRRIAAQHHRNKAIAISFASRGIPWPTLQLYREQFSQTGKLVDLPQVGLFDSGQMQILVKELRDMLLQPSRRQDLIWKNLARFKQGPYSSARTKSLFEACNINLSLVTKDQVDNSCI